MVIKGLRGAGAMFSSQKVIKTPMPARDVFIALKAFHDRREKSAVGIVKRFVLDGNILSQVRWDRITEDRAEGVFMKPERGQRGMQFTLTRQGENRIRIWYHTPNYAITLSIILIPLMFIIPILLILVLVMAPVAAGIRRKKIEAMEQSLIENARQHSASSSQMKLSPLYVTRLPRSRPR